MSRTIPALSSIGRAYASGWVSRLRPPSPLNVHRLQSALASASPRSARPTPPAGPPTRARLLPRRARCWPRSCSAWRGSLWRGRRIRGPAKRSPSALPAPFVQAKLSRGSLGLEVQS